MAQQCSEPGCNGTVVDGLCQVCGALYDANAPAPPSATVSPSSQEAGSSRRSSVSARPSSISSVLGTTSSRRSHHSGFVNSSSRRRLGAGLVEIEPQPDIEPLKLVRPDLRIPDPQRICSNPKCVDDKGSPTRLHLDKGFCPTCRSKYSFLQIPAGTVVSGQYEVKGPIAIGGCGFVYLAWDQNVERHVVLKGLINSMDAAAAANAVKEKRFLASLRDPSIVDIVNFVNQDGAQYIVMELVNGVTLKDIRKQRGPLPVKEAIAYTLGVLPGFEFLHSKKIIYCDFKMDNAMVSGDRLRLIDLGGARREDDLDSDLYLTQGYCAPEAEQTVSYSSDLYTVGRTLAILLMDFDFRGKHKHSLPTPQEVAIFSNYESLYRFLLRATAPKPDDRFQSAMEMGSQLEGVLREIVALDSKAPRPAESLAFAMDVGDNNGTPSHSSLPSMRVDRTDPAHSVVESALILNDPQRQKALFENATRQYPKSVEARLRLADVCIELGQYEQAQSLLDQLAQEDPYDWRVVWLRGRKHLARKSYQESFPLFDAVYSELPGELAPKLSLAIVSELKGDRETAVRLYDLVSTVDPGYTTAAFGLARCMPDARGAVAAYSRVPPMSIAYVPARLNQVRRLLEGKPTPQDLGDAAAILGELSLDGGEASRLEADLFLAAAKLCEGGYKGSEPTLLGEPMKDPTRLRARAEAALRRCAKFAPDRRAALALVEEANKVRPMSLW
ncbi:MAG: tetratricopeptide repeat protein [Candidatus Xenobia bacterium]